MENILKDWLPIGISVIAIFVTTFTVYRQNKIALFKIRYKAYNVLSYLFSVTEILLKADTSNTNVILYSSMETYKSSTTLNDTLANGDDVSSFYVGLIFEAGKAEHIFKKKHTKEIMQFLIIFNNLVSKTYTKKSYEKELKELQIIYSRITKYNINTNLKKYLNLH